MKAQKTTTPERQDLEARIGHSDVVPRPADLISGVWDAQVQADVIISRVRCSLRETVVLISNIDDAAALKLNKSYLGYQLQEPAAQNTLLIAAKSLARDAGLDPNDLHVHKKRGALSSIFGPTIYLVFPNADTAQQMLNHVQSGSIKSPEPA